MKELILTSSVLILAIALLRRLLRGRLDPRVQYALWLLAAVRLLVPGTLFASPVSVAGAAAELERAVQVRMLPPAAAEAERAPAGAYPARSLPEDIPAAPAAREGTGWPEVVWKTGIAAVGAALAASNLAFYLDLRKRRRRAELPPEAGCGPLRVYVAEGLTSPCLFGLVRPAVYLTPQALASEHLDCVLAHEYTHFRHGDHLWALLRSLCLAVHWYNPLVWRAAALSRRDCELACDAGAIARLGEARRLDYGQALLRLVPAGRGSLLRTATTMTAGKRTMAERVALIAKRPRTLKITLALVALVMCAAAAVTFGGAAEKPEDPPEDVLEPSAQPLPEDPADTPARPPAITEAEARLLYAQAREAWDWFDLGTMPLTNETYTEDGAVFNRVDGFGSLTDLRRCLESLFAPEIADYLLESAGPLLERGGGLYVQAAGRGSDLNAGEETVTAFVYTPEEAEEYGYAAHVFARTEVLDADLETVLGYKRHDFYAAWNGSEYVFTNFGPWDDVDPQLFYNAQEIQKQIASGADTEDWLPLLSYMDWGALGATGGGELCTAVDEALYTLVQERGGELTMAQYLYILSATEGLDGAWAEGFQVIVYDLYTLDSAKFAHVVLEEVPQEQQDAIINFLSWEWSQRGEDAPTREEIVTRLEAGLARALFAEPASAVLTGPGDTFRFQLLGAQGIYAASYTSADANVARVDQDGTVTAVGPGETTITLHYEGEAGNQDFTCKVHCQW